MRGINQAQYEPGSRNEQAFGLPGGMMKPVIMFSMSTMESRIL
jgi:hypothetical protein